MRIRQLIAKIVGKTARCVLAGLVVASFCATPSPTATAAVASHVAPKPAGTHTGPIVHGPKNPHVHVPTAVKTPTKSGLSKPAAKGFTKTSTKSVTHVRTARRVYLHHSAGTVTGVVHGPAGHVVANARVRLTKALGGEIRNRHARHSVVTNSAGAFVMRGVHSGRFRVVAAKKNVGSGHNGVLVSTHGNHHVPVKLVAASSSSSSSGKKKRK